MYIWCFDLSLSCSGVCIFSENGKPVHIFSVPTNPKKSHGERLKTIADAILEIKDQYPCRQIVLEAGFTRFSTSTQVLFRVHGLINYMFWDCEQRYFAPSTVKKIVTGNGRAEKSDVQRTILKRWPELIFKNEDESDACSIGLCWFKEQGILK